MDSVLQTEKKCFYCGDTRDLEMHHIFGGADRKVSEKYGLKVWLCNRHHTGNVGVHFDAEFAQWLHEVGQQKWEHDRIAEGMTSGEARERFRKEFRKSYL